MSSSTRHWLTEVARAFAAFPEADVVSGLLLPLELDTDAQLWFEQYGGFSRGFDRRIFDLNAHRPRDEPLYPWTAGLFGTGNNFSFRAGALREIGGFDPALGNGTPALGGVIARFAPDRLTGHTIVYEPRAIVLHAHRPDYDALRRQVYAYGAGLSAYYLKTLLANPALLKDFARKLPVGLRFALSSGSSKNSGKTAKLPPRADMARASWDPIWTAGVRSQPPQVRASSGPGGKTDPVGGSRPLSGPSASMTPLRRSFKMEGCGLGS